LNELTSQDWSVGTGISSTEQEIKGLQFSVREINIFEGVDSTTKCNFESGKRGKLR
jgi:hypothetical protein